MRANFFKKLLCGALALAVILIGCNINTSSIVYAESSVDYINYVSLGDSIATGYGLEGYASDLDFIAGSYETLFKTHIQNYVGDVDAKSYAVDGYTSNNLLTSLQTDSTVRSSIQNADVITISIGGNDLLGLAKSNVINCFLEGSYASLKTTLSNAVTNFDTVFGNILSEINTLNSNAKILVTNVFNPYRSLMTTTKNITLNLTDVVGFGNTSVVMNYTSIQEFGKLTESYIAGDSAENITGINQIMQQHIANRTNCYYIDSKAAFDGRVGEYTDVACASLTKYDEITMTFNDAYYNGKIFDYLDPHPTALGHQILAREFQSGFSDNLAFIVIDYNGGTLDNMLDDKYITLKNKTISQPLQPTKEHHTFKGWSTNKNNLEIYDFSNDVVSNLTLYANWEAITFVVKFDYNGGVYDGNTFAEITVAEGMTVIAPSGEEIPVLEKFMFVGWFADETLTEEFDFNTQIYEDTTIYAKWEQIAFDVTLDYNGGKIGEETSTTIVVNKNDYLVEPAGENLPILLDHGLVGWYTDPDFENAWNFETDKVTGNLTLYAKWECNVWYITFNFNGGNVNGVNNQVIKIAKGNKLEEPAFEDLVKTGYVFVYWYLTDSKQEFDFENTDITSNLTLYAYWQYGITIKIQYPDMVESINIAKDSTVADLSIPKRSGTMFFGWFSAATCLPEEELPGSRVLVNGQTVYVKWITLRCENESLLIQEFSPISQNVNWHIDARNGSIISWQVNGQAVEHGTGEVMGDHGNYWSFNPSLYGVGTYVITCIVDGGVVNGGIIEIDYSVPADVLINLDSVVSKKTYVVEVDNQQYYNANNFVWYKTADPYSDEFDEEIGRGFELSYTFDNDCNICVKYLIDSEDNYVMSNIIKVSVDNHIDTFTTIAIVITLLVVVVIVFSAVFSYRKHKDLY